MTLIPTNYYGIYHGVNSGITSWYEFAKKIFELADYKHVMIEPQITSDLARPALRPLYSPLDNRMLRLAVGHEMQHWALALKQYIRNL